MYFTRSLTILILLSIGAVGLSTQKGDSQPPQSNADELAQAAFPDRTARDATEGTPAPTYVTLLWAGGSSCSQFLPYGLLVVGRDEDARAAARTVTWRSYHDPQTWFELTDLNGNAIALTPEKVDPDVPMPTVSLRRPGNYIAESLRTGEVLLIEPFSVPLTTPLPLGKHRVRLRKPTSPFEDKSHGYINVDERWLEFEMFEQPEDAAPKKETKPVEILSGGKLQFSDGYVILPLDSRRGDVLPHTQLPPADQLASLAFPDHRAIPPDRGIIRATLLWAGEGPADADVWGEEYLPVGLMVIGPKSKVRQVGFEIGGAMYRKPATWLELVDNDGKPIAWAPADDPRHQRDMIVNGWQAGKQVAEPLQTGEMLSLEPRNIALAKPLAPGRYRIRFHHVEPLPSGIPVNFDHQWLEFEIPEHRPERPKPEPRPAPARAEILPGGKVRLPDGRVVSPLDRSTQ